MGFKHASSKSRDMRIQLVAVGKWAARFEPNRFALFAKSGHFAFEVDKCSSEQSRTYFKDQLAKGLDPIWGGAVLASRYLKSGVRPQGDALVSLVRGIAREDEREPSGLGHRFPAPAKPVSLAKAVEMARHSSRH